MSQTRTDSSQPKFAAGRPDFTFEISATREGYSSVCGVDEAGRGPLAGPVVAAAAIIDREMISDDLFQGLDDSKKLSAIRRDELFEAIIQSTTCCIASVDSKQIDCLNIRRASLLAMQRAVTGLPVLADFALIDGNALPDDLPCAARTIVKGDSRSLSIAAASILAKVTRDRMMLRADLDYPGYGFARHKGYGTKVHMEALQRLGPCPIHRASFAPVSKASRGRMHLNAKKPG